AYEDLDLYLRLARAGDLLPVDGEPVTTYRLHGANTPSPRLYEGALRVAEKHLPRTSRRAARRAAGAAGGADAAPPPTLRPAARRRCAAAMRIALLTEIPAPFRLPL